MSSNWEPLVKTSTPKRAIAWKHLVEEFGVAKQYAKNLLRYMDSMTYWQNSTYFVSTKKRNGHGSYDFAKETYNGVWTGESMWISFHRHDREPVIDWRDMQNSKNDVAGPEWEAIQIFPSESRLMDTANEYHMFAFNGELPIGFFIGRAIQEPETVKSMGGKQRKYE